MRDSRIRASCGYKSFYTFAARRPCIRCSRAPQRDQRAPGESPDRFRGRCRPFPTAGARHRWTVFLIPDASDPLRVSSHHAPLYSGFLRPKLERPSRASAVLNISFKRPSSISTASAVGFPTWASIISLAILRARGAL